MWRYLRSLIGLLMLLAVVVPVLAQAEPDLIVSSPDTTLFPTLTYYLDAQLPEGDFYYGLEPSDIQVLEDDQAVDVTGLEELVPGVQVVFAVNPARAFSIRDSQGVSRFDSLANHLQQWAFMRQGTTLDDVSLLVGTGTNSMHQAQAAAAFTPLAELEAQEFPDDPDLDILFQAVDLASDPTPRPGMGRAVVLITALLDQTLETGLQNLISQARQQNIRVFVWLVASGEQFDTPQADLLRSLAEQTGGDFLAYSGVEPLPSPELYLRHLRSVYKISHQSKLTAAGMHTLAVEITALGRSAPVEFELEIQPPNPAFLSPPARIVRRLPEGERLGWGEQVAPESLEPQQQELALLVEFPDHRPRPITRVSLYIDDRLASERLAPPFDRFEWNLNPYLTTGRHILQVEVEDTLGLVGRSIQVPVEVSVQLPVANPLSALAPHAPIILGLGIFLILAVVAVGLILSGRIRPGQFAVPRRLSARLPRRWRGRQSDERLPTPEQNRPLTGWANRLHWPQRRIRSQAPAYLVRESTGEVEHLEYPIHLFSDEATLGSDRDQATILFDDPSLCGLHARLMRREEDIYWLRDEGSIAGTWVNFREIPADGIVLQHDDLIHIGRVVLRFKLRTPKMISKPVIHYESIYQ